MQRFLCRRKNRRNRQHTPQGCKSEKRHRQPTNRSDQHSIPRRTDVKPSGRQTGRRIHEATSMNSGHPANRGLRPAPPNFTATVLSHSLVTVNASASLLPFFSDRRPRFLQPLEQRPHLTLVHDPPALRRSNAPHPALTPRQFQSARSPD